MVQRAFVLAVCFAVAAVAGEALAQGKKPYSLGVIPQMPAARLAALWVPLLQQVSQRAGVELLFQTGPDIGEYYKRVERGQYDLLYTNPLHYLQANSKQGYAAFAKEKDKKLAGIIVTRAESPLKALTDLRGKKVMMPASAFAANILIRGVLNSAGILPGMDVTIKEVASHDSAYLAVFAKQADAAGGVTRTFSSMPANVQAELRIMHTTQGFTSHPFAAKPNVPAEVVAKIRDALIAVGSDPANLKMLEELQMAKGFAGAADQDYADARTFAATAVATAR